MSGQCEEEEPIQVYSENEQVYAWLMLELCDGYVSRLLAAVVVSVMVDLGM